MDGQVLHPAVGGSSVPVFDPFGNLDDRPRNELYGSFAPFLIPAATGYADKHLHLFVVYVPVVAASRLEAHVCDPAVHLGQITVAREVLGISGIGLSFGPHGEIYGLDRGMGIAKNRFKRSAQPFGLRQSDFLFQ